MKTNLSADNFKKIVDLNELIPESVIGSGGTGQWIPCFDSCQTSQLITTWISNIRLHLGFQTMTFNIGFPVVQMDGRSGSWSGYSQVITKLFSRMDRFTYLWGSPGAHGALLLSSTVGKSQQKHKNVQVDCQTSIQPSTNVFPKIVAGDDYFFFGTKRGRLFEER